MVSLFYEPACIAHITTNEGGLVSVHYGEQSHEAECRILPEGDYEGIFPYVNIQI